MKIWILLWLVATGYPYNSDFAGNRENWDSKNCTWEHWDERWKVYASSTALVADLKEMDQIKDVRIFTGDEYGLTIVPKELLIQKK